MTGTTHFIAPILLVVIILASFALSLIVLAAVRSLFTRHSPPVPEHISVQYLVKDDGAWMYWVLDSNSGAVLAHRKGKERNRPLAIEQIRSAMVAWRGTFDEELA